MLTIYGSDLSGPAIKVRLTATYLGLEHKWQIINLREGEQKQEWFLKINPVGKIPAMDDEGFHLFESNAICKYLAEKQGSPLLPKDLKTRAVIEQWIDFITVHIGVHAATVTYSRVFAPRLNRPVNEQALADALKFLEQYLPILEKQLSAHAYVAGKSITLADLTLLAVLEPAELSGIKLSAYPKLAAWRQDLKQQSFYTKCYKEYGEQLLQKK
jgi:glutathione S-transferase